MHEWPISVAEQFGHDFSTPHPLLANALNCEGSQHSRFRRQSRRMSPEEREIASISSAIRMLVSSFYRRDSGETMSQESDQPWFHAGLRFECTRCGRCCRGPGNVWVSDTEIESLAEKTAIDADEFRRTQIKRSGRRGFVLRQKRNQDCIFWDGARGCQVYDSRPRQCRTYPFWKANLQSEADWDRERRSCPGVGEGHLYSRETIESLSTDDGIPAHRTASRERRPNLNPSDRSSGDKIHT